MLEIQDFFAACVGAWKTERTYHYPLHNEVERSYTEFNVSALTVAEKQRISSDFLPAGSMSATVEIDDFPGFRIGFSTVSEKGERVAMNLKAIFVPDRAIVAPQLLPTDPLAPAMPLTAEILDSTEVIRGLYLRDEGYSETGAITGRFTYLPSRQTLELVTYYSRSVAVDQLRLISPTTRLRTIVTYQRPQPGEVPTVVNLVGFGLEQKS
ncbi:phycobiliprotein lyase [Chamaesiphon sp. VAR_69_metabat_338]|uniref:phycobiliprotein lyase n=1 Tax=Chamaesiphon sp. VAR_69_metabat_338 TaxID=2964704 RepID=UPI00286DB814|nr:phycobiliprotein lyase [Chamaesiphon sp. VAR_69_metabat_338]